MRGHLCPIEAWVSPHQLIGCSCQGKRAKERDNPAVGK
jgi:hypothetical protein